MELKFKATLRKGKRSPMAQHLRRKGHVVMVDKKKQADKLQCRKGVYHGTV